MWNKIKKALTWIGGALISLAKSKATVELTVSVGIKTLLKKKPEHIKYVEKTYSLLDDIKFDDDSTVSMDSLIKIFEENIKEFPDDYKAGIVSLLGSANEIIGEKVGAENRGVIEDFIIAVKAGIKKNLK